MALKRRLRDYSRSIMCIILLFMCGNISATLSGFDYGTGLNLDCNNDKESMTCHLKSQTEDQINCTEYSLTVPRYKIPGVEHCTFQQFDMGGCNCSVQMKFYLGEIHTATVWKGNKWVESKHINITATLKPKTPKIISVNESNGNFQVWWKTDMDDYLNLQANVTYYKKGDTKKESKFDPQRPVNRQNYYVIHGQDLEPSQTYVVSVKSYSHLSGKFSDSSKECEFITPASSHALILAVIISLSIVATIITCTAFGCYEKLKAKWWDTVPKCPNPKLLDMQPGEQKLLRLSQTSFSSVSIEPAVLNNSEHTAASSTQANTGSGSPQQSTASSPPSANTRPVNVRIEVQDALGKVFAHLRPITPLTTNLLTGSNKDGGLISTPYNPCSARGEDSKCSPGATGFINKTYSSLPPVGPSLLPTDMSYQPRNVDSISSATNTTTSCDPVSRVEAGCEGFDEEAVGATNMNEKIKEATVCDVNPCDSRVPPGSDSFPPVDDDYQAL